MRSETGRTYKSEGIVLKRTNFGEADKIVTIYSKHFGKLTVLAKGIRRMTSRKRGNLEVFNRIIFFAVKGKGMDIITETELLDSFSELRKDLHRVAVAYQLSEMVDKMTAEESEQEDVFDLLSSYLQTLESAESKNLAVMIDSFGGNMLKLLGFWPKNKPIPMNFNVTGYIEDIIEKELKAKNFLNRI